ncbi:MAG: hypothetical protein V3S55_06435 [Nitrospiraceae bacterium]
MSASDLNGEFNNIVNNGEDLGWPATKSKDLDGQSLLLDSDADSHLTADTDDRLDLALAGTDLFRFDGTATTPVNGIDFIARATGSPATIQAQGSDSNVALDIRDDNGNELLVFAAVGSAVNDLTISNAATGNPPTLDSSGESDIGLQIRDSNDNELLIFSSVGSALNEITITNAATGNNALLAVTGETNASLELRSRGTGNIILADDSGNQILIANDVASAINEITVENAIINEHPEIQATGDDTNINIDLIPKGTGVVQSAGLAVGLAGKQAIPIPVSNMTPTVSNGCSALTLVETTADRPDLVVRDFSTAADEHCQFGFSAPKSWNESTVTFQAVYTHNGGQTGGLDGVAWFLQGLAVSNSESADQAYGTAVVVTNDDATAEDVHTTSVSGNVTLAGTPAEEDYLFFRVGRDVSDGADDLDIDAGLMGVILFFTTNVGNDA